MTVLLALCPLVVETADNLRDRPSDSDGARAWVWRRLDGSGRGGVAEAVRVFEGGARRSRASSASAAGGGGGAERREKHAAAVDDEKDEWDRVATSADCYNFVRETGIITAGELFLGAAPPSDNGGDGSQAKGRASGKKRKAASVSLDGGDDATTAAAAAGPVDEARTFPAAQPRVLRSLAGVVERFGMFLEGFPFQSLVGEGEKGWAADTKAGSSRSNDR